MQSRHNEIFDCCWKRDQEEFPRSPTFCHWEATDAHEIHLENVEGSDREAEWERVVTVERVPLSKNSKSKSLHGQAFRMMESSGPTAETKWDQYVSTAIPYMRMKRCPEITGSVTIGSRHNAVSNPSNVVRSTRERSTWTTGVAEPRTPDVVVVEEVAHRVARDGEGAIYLVEAWNSEDVAAALFHNIRATE